MDVLSAWTINDKYINYRLSIVSTYDHRTLKTRLPVRSALFKQRTGGLVVRWVTTSEYPLLYVFVFCCFCPSFVTLLLTIACVALFSIFGVCFVVTGVVPLMLPGKSDMLKCPPGVCTGLVDVGDSSTSTPKTSYSCSGRSSSNYDGLYSSTLPVNLPRSHIMSRLFSVHDLPSTSTM